MMPAPIYPLKISANRRYLVDQNDQPVLVHGDSPWSLIVQLTPDEVDLYLDDRKAKGFNALIVNLIEHKFADNPPSNRFGHGPFTTPGDFATPNEKYFEYADWVINRVGEKGFLLFLAVTFVGYCGGPEGWEKEMMASGPEKCRQFGRFAARRYRHHDHVLWYIACDQNLSKARKETEALAEGVREEDDRLLMTALGSPEHSATAVFQGATWLDVNATYSYKLVHDRLREDWRHEPVMPFLLNESTYEGEHNSSPLQVRRQAYWALLRGACGQFMGNRPIWLFDRGWKDALDSPTAIAMTHLKRLFESRPWWQLVPDVDHKVVTGGLGEFHGLDYLTAAITADGGTLMAYMPSARVITVDLAKLSGDRAQAWWFNPRTGETIRGAEIASAGSAQVWPPDEGDWALVLDDSAKNLPAPGQTAPSRDVAPGIC